MVAASNAARYEALATSNSRRPARTAPGPGRLMRSSRCPRAPPSRGLRRRVGIDPVLPEVVGEVPLIDAEEPRRLLADAAGAAQRLDHRLALAARQDRTEGRLLRL